MFKKLIALGFILVLFSGCSKKLPVALPSSSSHNSLPAIEASNNGAELEGSVTPVAARDTTKFQKGKISSNGKYLGTDGLSRSGFKMLYFATDSYTLDDDQIKRLMSDIPKLKATAANSKLLVEGNCDEFGTDEYNHALGLKRAKAVKSLMVSAGIPANRIDIVSYGESNPVCTINAPACHAKNRRVEINKI